MNVPRDWRLKIPRYRLVGEKCDCESVIFPPRDICPDCGENLGPFSVDLGLAMVRELSAINPEMHGAEDYWLGFLNKVINGNNE